ncbi:uncharacterized protein F5147DRAFT_659364 [Suillus discolor]|uniref:Uncharacterized protein n=1 Tax=Suillus discolor TaxID=1912936 RepID=A0A9P7ERG9_9AGAM|nr:uncharacterized protein F5147DRAFT_659364 [Suillus discolor]KAG2085885.1 hypothetical protein F5147DRAFT_659364 [Suillus discolor]
MSDHDSASESDSSKQPPLNQEEVAILKSYIEQWDAAEPLERKMVSKAAATKARTKAPVMSIRLLKDQKVTERSVMDTLWKKELLEKIQDETGAKPGMKEMINHYTKQLNQLIASLSLDELQEAKETAELWNHQGIPDDVKADIARKKGNDMIHHFATEMWNHAGMRVFVVSAWKNEEGKIHIAGHDYNNEYGSADSFMKTHKWDTILPEWDSYAESAFDGNLDGDGVVTRKKGRQDKTYVLEVGDDGYPVLPPCDAMDLETKKAVIRAFLTWHYRKCCGDPKISVPWKYVIPRYAEIIPAECLPDGHNLAEPSKLKQVHATQLLQFWYNQQEQGDEPVLEFIGSWDNNKEDMVLAADMDARVTTPTQTTRKSKQKSVSWNQRSPGLQLSTGARLRSHQSTKKARTGSVQCNSKTKTRPGAHLPGGTRNGMENDPSDYESDDQLTNESVAGFHDTEEEIPRRHKASKGKSKRQDSISSDKNSSSDAEQPEEFVSSRKTCKKVIAGSPVEAGAVDVRSKKITRAVECPQHVVRKHGGKGTEHEPSAISAKLTANAPKGRVEQPAKTVNTADIIRGHTRVQKRTAKEFLEGSPAKRTRHQVVIQQDKGTVTQAGNKCGRKQVVEEATNGSPLKRTRSKTLPPGAGKCSRKPNSWYNDYVKP